MNLTKAIAGRRGKLNVKYRVGIDELCTVDREIVNVLHILETRKPMLSRRLPEISGIGRPESRLAPAFAAVIYEWRDEMEFIILVLGTVLCLTLPVHCYNEGQYKIKCLEMRGSLEQKGDNLICTPHTESKQPTREG